MPITRLTALQREAARLEGEQGQLKFGIAEANSKIKKAELQIVRSEQEFRTEVMKDLRDAQDKEAELSERIVAAYDQLKRVDIRAPVDGIVDQLSVHTIGGVIAPGELILEVVPDTDDLIVEARLPPSNIDQVRLKQIAYVRFSAFNQRTTPQTRGSVFHISADLNRDKQTNSAFYSLRISLSRGERSRFSDLQLTTGMPAEIFMQTGKRTMMSYLLKPLTDQIQRAFN